MIKTGRELQLKRKIETKKAETNLIVRKSGITMATMMTVTKGRMKTRTERRDSMTMAASFE
jgi:hypothetical protein